MDDNELVDEDQQMETDTAEYYLERLNTLKLSQKAIEAEIEELQATAVKEMNALRLKELQFTDEYGRPVKATVVTGTTRTVDIELLAEMDKALADAVCDMKVNMAKVKKAESMGLFTQPKFKAVFHEKPKRPYVLFTSPEEETSE